MKSHSRFLYGPGIWALFVCLNQAQLRRYLKRHPPSLKNIHKLGMLILQLRNGRHVLLDFYDCTSYLRPPVALNVLPGFSKLTQVALKCHIPATGNSFYWLEYGSALLGVEGHALQITRGPNKNHDGVYPCQELTWTAKKGDYLNRVENRDDTLPEVVSQTRYLTWWEEMGRHSQFVRRPTCYGLPI
jgi:hypothetical protein